MISFRQVVHQRSLENQRQREVRPHAADLARRESRQASGFSDLPELPELPETFTAEPEELAEAPTVRVNSRVFTVVTFADPEAEPETDDGG